MLRSIRWPMWVLMGIMLVALATALALQALPVRGQTPAAPAYQYDHPAPAAPSEPAVRYGY